MALPLLTTGGQIAVNATPLTIVNLVGYAWTVVDAGFTDLWRGPDVGGSNIPIPGAADYPMRRYPRTSTRQIPMFVTGECNVAGTPNADAIKGIEENIDYLRANVFDPPAIADRPNGTRHLTMTMPSGSTRSGDVHFGPLTISEAAPWGWLIVAEVEIPAGALA